MNRGIATCLAALVGLLVGFGCARAVHVSPEGSCILAADDLAKVHHTVERVCREYGMEPSHTMSLGVESSGAPKTYALYEGRHAEGYTKVAVRLSSFPRRVSIRVTEQAGSFDSGHSSQLRAEIENALKGIMGRCDVRVGLEFAEEQETGARTGAG